MAAQQVVVNVEAPTTIVVGAGLLTIGGSYEQVRALAIACCAALEAQMKKETLALMDRAAQRRPLGGMSDRAQADDEAAGTVPL